MSDLSSLTKLAQFSGKSRLSGDPATRRRALRALTAHLDTHGPRRTVTELLAIVMALSARTRRVVAPPVAIDLDVFSPTGDRAVRLRLPQNPINT